MTCKTFAFGFGFVVTLFAAGCAAPEEKENTDSQESRSTLLPGHANEDATCGGDTSLVYDEETGSCFRRDPLPGHANEDTSCGSDTSLVYDEETGSCFRRDPLPGHANEDTDCPAGQIYDEEYGRCVRKR